MKDLLEKYGNETKPDVSRFLHPGHPKPVRATERELFNRAMDFLRKAWAEERDVAKNETKAVELLQKAIQINPDYIDAYEVLKNIYTRGDISDCKKATETHEKQAPIELYKNLSVSDNILPGLWGKHCEEAKKHVPREYLADALKRDRISFFERYDLGRQKYREYMSWLLPTKEDETAIYNMPLTDADVKRALQKVERHKKALAIAPYYSKEKVKSEIASLFAFISVRYYKNDALHARKYCEEALKWAPDYWRCFMVLGWAYSELGQIEKAIKFYERYPTDADLSNKAKAELEKLKSMRTKKR